MKQFEVTEFLHIKGGTDTLIESKDIVIDNLSNQISVMKKYNKQGYNIYKTFNTFFDGKRRTSNINELKFILIDLDYSETGEKEDYIQVRKRAKQLEKRYGIYPSEINETFKGYHLLYPLDESLYYIKNNLYLELAEILVEYFGADKRAKQITGLYKLVGFYDHKDGRNFLIENRYIATNTEKKNKSITRKTLEEFGIIEEGEELSKILKTSIYGLKLKWDKEGNLNVSHLELQKNENLKKLTTTINRKTKQHNNYQMIENIDAKIFIEKINEYQKGPFKDIYINVNKKSIDNTHGLKLYYNQGKFEIKDFAEKKRFGNRLFLLNYALKMGEDSSKFKKKDKFKYYVLFLKENFGINFNIALDKFYISNKLLFDYINKKITIKKHVFEKIKERYNINYSYEKDKELVLDSIIKLYFALEKFRQVDFVNENKIKFRTETLLDYLGLKKRTENIKKLYFLLELGSQIEFSFNYYNKNHKYISTIKKLYNIKIAKNDISYSPIIGNINNNGSEIKVSDSFSLFNDSIISKNTFRTTKYIRLTLYIVYSVNKFKNITITFNQIKKLLNLGNIEDEYLKIRIVSILKHLKKNKLIGHYEKGKNVFKIGKFNYKKLNKNKKRK